MFPQQNTTAKAALGPASGEYGLIEKAYCALTKATALTTLSRFGSNRSRVRRGLQFVATSVGLATYSMPIFAPISIMRMEPRLYSKPMAKTALDNIRAVAGVLRRRPRMKACTILQAVKESKTKKTMVTFANHHASDANSIRTYLLPIYKRQHLPALCRADIGIDWGEFCLVQSAATLDVVCSIVAVGLKVFVSLRLISYLYGATCVTARDIPQWPETTRTALVPP